MYQYNGKVIKVYDGDTITIEIDLGFKIKKEVRVRLLGINAPEVRGEEREDGLISRDKLRELILGKNVIVTTKKDKKGKYGRYLGDISYTRDDGEVYSVNEWLVTEGLAVYKEY